MVLQERPELSIQYGVLALRYLNTELSMVAGTHLIMASASSQSCKYMDFEKFPIYVGDVPGSSLDRHTGYLGVWWFSSLKHQNASVPLNRTRLLAKTSESSQH
jgi:hypothetical protein